MIAIGATAVVPSALKPAGDLIHTHESIFGIAGLPRRMAVVGAGPQGLELAQAFSRLGVEVILLDHTGAVSRTKDPAAAKVAM